MVRQARVELAISTLATQLINHYDTTAIYIYILSHYPYQLHHMLVLNYDNLDRVKLNFLLYYFYDYRQYGQPVMEFFQYIGLFFSGFIHGNCPDILLQRHQDTRLFNIIALFFEFFLSPNLSNCRVCRRFKSSEAKSRFRGHETCGHSMQSHNAVRRSRFNGKIR